MRYSSLRNKRLLFVLVAVALAVGMTLGSAAQAEDPDIAVRRAAERTNFSDADIKDGFFKTAFHAELQFDRAAERIRRFDGPVRVFVVNRSMPDRGADLAAVIADIRAHVAHLDLALTDDRKAANFIVTLVHERDLAKTIRAYYGADRAKQIQRALAPECLSGIGKDQSHRIRRADVILPVDAGDFTFFDCAYEELLQGLGLINDDASVPWTMFNDNVQMGFFDRYDQYLVNILYDPLIQPGMTKDAVDKLLPDILPAVRAWVDERNVPRGARASSSTSE